MGAIVELNNFVDSSAIPSTPRMEQRAMQLVHGYNPSEFLAMQKVIVDFTKEAGGLIAEGDRVIEVPENVAQAASYIKNEQVNYNKGQELVRAYAKEARLPYILKMFGKLLGGTALLLLGFPVFSKRVAAVFFNPKKTTRNAN